MKIYQSTLRASIKNYIIALMMQMTLSNINEGISERITRSDISEVSKISPMIVNKASKRLTSNKSDTVSEIVPDYLINYSDILYTHLSNVMQSYVIHGH